MKVSKKEIIKVKNKLYDKFKIPVFELDNETKKLFEQCQIYFSSEEVSCKR